MRGMLKTLKNGLGFRVMLSKIEIRIIIITVIITLIKVRGFWGEPHMMDDIEALLLSSHAILAPKP